MHRYLKMSAWVLAGLALAIVAVLALRPVSLDRGGQSVPCGSAAFPRERAPSAGERGCGDVIRDARGSMGLWAVVTLPLLLLAATSAGVAAAALRRGPALTTPRR